MSRPLVRTAIVALAVATAAACSRDHAARSQYFLQRGDAYFAKGNFKAAAIEYGNAVKQKSDSVVAHRKLADAAQRMHDSVTAVSETLQLAALQPRDLRVQLDAADTVARLGQPIEAELPLQRALAVDPSNPAANRALATLYTATGRAAAAEACWTRVANHPDGDPFALADFYISQQRLREAEKELRRVAAGPRKGQAADLRLAAFLFARQRGDEAEAALENVLRRDPGSTEAWLLRGRERVLEGRPDEARQAFQTVLELEPHSVDALAGLTSVDMAREHAPQALARIDAELSKRPDEVALLMLKARAALRAHDDQGAERALTRVVAVAPTEVAAYTLLGDLYVRQGRLDAARDEFQRLASVSADPVGPRTMVALILQAQHRTEEARRTYESILAAQPNAGIAANNLAWIELQANRVDEALRNALVAKEQLPQLANVNDTLGWVYCLKDRARDAIPLLAKAVELQPDNALYRYHLARAYEQSGLPKQAIEQLDRTASITAASSDLKLEMQRLRDRLRTTPSGE